MKKINKRFLEMCEIYKIMAKDKWLDWSEKSLREAYEYETYGNKKIFENENYKKNGYYIGKQRTNIMIETWKKDIENGILCKADLLFDDEIPNWFIHKAFNRVIIHLNEEGKTFRYNYINSFKKK